MVALISSPQKLDVRERKRDTLPAGSGWASKKYDAAFTIQQMSDDEDTFEDGKLVPNVYTSRASKSRAAVVSVNILRHVIYLTQSRSMKCSQK
jgi:hypothetical protein